MKPSLLLPLLALPSATAKVCSATTEWFGSYKDSIKKPNSETTTDSDLINGIGLTTDTVISKIETSSMNRVFGIKVTLSDADDSKLGPEHGVANDDDGFPIHRVAIPSARIQGVGLMMAECDGDDGPWGCGFVTSFDFFYEDGSQSGNMGNLIGEHQYVNISAYEPNAWLLGLNTVDSKDEDEPYVYAQQYIYAFEC